MENKKIRIGKSITMDIQIGTFKEDKKLLCKIQNKELGIADFGKTQKIALVNFIKSAKLRLDL